MKKKGKKVQPSEMPLRNPVARYAGKFNRAETFRDRTKYRRSAKHKGREPFPMPPSRPHRKAFVAVRASHPGR